MSSASTPSSIFHRLPPELLATILNYTLECDEPFALAYCCEREPHVDESDYAYTGDNMGVVPRQRFDIYYPHCQIRKFVRSDTSTMQTYHFSDWLRMNTTCRLFRETGTDLFFRRKIFVMSAEVAKQLQTRTYPLWTAENQERAIRCIRHIAIYQTEADNPAKFLDFPKRVAGFVGLKYVTIAFCADHDYPLQELRIAMMGTCAMPEELEGGLKSIGMRTDIKYQIALGLNVDWDCLDQQLRYYVFPVFAFKTRIRTLWDSQAKREDGE